MSLDNWNVIIPLVAFLLAMLIAIYSWNHMRSFAVGVVVWFGLAFTLSSWGFFQGTSGWADDDIVGFIVFGTLMTLPLI